MATLTSPSSNKTKTPLKESTAAMQSTSNKKQLSILGFFSRKPTPATAKTTEGATPPSSSSKPPNSSTVKSSSALTAEEKQAENREKEVEEVGAMASSRSTTATSTSPLVRQQSTPVTYSTASTAPQKLENNNDIQEEEEEDDVPLIATRKRLRKKGSSAAAAVVVVSSESEADQSDDDDSSSEFENNKEDESEMAVDNNDEDDVDDDDSMAGFIVDDDDEEDDDGSLRRHSSKKRRTSSSKTPSSSSKQIRSNSSATTPSSITRTPSATTTASSTTAKLKTTFTMNSGSKTSAGAHYSSSSSTATTPKTPSASFLQQSSTTSELKKADRLANFKEKNDERYSWLVNIKDKQGRPTTDQDYDPRTLFIPPAARHKFTDFEKQFWDIKADHWDTIVFFKKGKFYELYEKDADIGHQKFDLKLTDRVNMRMVGVPESSFEHWASQFIAKGFKVAKVDQLETGVGKTLREKESKGKKDKVIRRELTCVLTKGTLVDSGMLTDDMSTYCMAIKEIADVSSQVSVKSPVYGIAFVDTSTAEFNLSYFVDDVDRTQLETLLLQVKPKEIVLEKGSGGVSDVLKRLVRNSLNDPGINYLVPEKEFWDADRTRIEIKKAGYFQNGGGEGCDDDDVVMQEEDSSSTAASAMPDALKEVYENDVLMTAFGGLVSYLRSLKLDKELVSAANLHLYNPVKHSGSLILDGQTLLNLDIFETGGSGGGDQGSLFNLLNKCVTPFGKRLFKRWVCHPLRSAQDINNRLDAIDELNDSLALQDNLRSAFKSLPDLERIISRIHTGTCRVKDFIAALSAFKKILSLKKGLESDIGALESTRLGQLLQDGIPAASLKTHLDFFFQAFDHKEAVNGEAIVVYSGFDANFDEANDNIKAIESRLEDLRKDYARKLGCKIVFKDLGKELFQLEVPAKTKTPSSWVQMSKTQAVARYWNDDVRELVKEFLEAREIRDEALRSVKGRLYNKFDAQYSQWLMVVKSIAELDCLIGLAQCRHSLGETTCRPEIVEETQQGSAVLELESLRHPCVMQGVADDFIANDTKLGGGDDSNIILLTGPNMGGKSTLLRQTCIAVIMAQLGCYVPASKCRLTPFDRIFTRIGANDNILAGQSTFMVELSETSKILREATPRSLVILDELGRGTSTFDGYAIAYAVLHHLTSRVRCLGLFSTHYQMLTEEFKNNPIVKLMFMNFVSNDEKHDITFLYKLTRGVCPKSFGMVVASMAGVPLEIIETADRVAGEFEKSQRWQEAQVSASKTGLGLNFKFSSLMQSLKQLAPGSGTSAVKRVDELESVKMIWKGFAAAS